VIIAGDVRRFGHVINKDGVLGTHNHLFVGSDGGSARWATVCSLSATAKLNNVEPFSVASWNNSAFVRRVIERKLIATVRRESAVVAAAVAAVSENSYIFPALIVEYRDWKDGSPSDPKLAHPHCLLRVSPMEHQERAQRRRM
jgi:hypothetical protein